MLNTGKCPHCSKVVSSVKIEHVQIIEGFTPKWNGVSYLCQHCGVVLGVGIDPVALKTDAVEAIRASLKK